MKTQLKIERKPEVLNRTGFSRSTLHARIKQKLFVPPVSLGERAVGWVSSEVDSCISAIIAGQTKQEIKDLVSSIIESRKNNLEILK